MSIISPSDFKGDRLIAQIEQLSVSTSVQWFIDKYEPKFLKMLLGDTLYQEFLSGLEEDPIPAKWVELRDETDIKQMIIDYVYYWYHRNNVTNTGGVGESKIKSDNAVSASPNQKMVTAWNDMVNMARMFDLSTETYPNWHRVYWRHHAMYGHCIPEIYEYINQLGL